MRKEIQHHLLFVYIRELIEQSKQQIAVSVIATLSLPYCQIDKRINQEIGFKNHAEKYVKQILATLWRQLET